MIGFLLSTIGIFGLVFLEHLLFTLLSFSVYILTSVHLWNRVSSRHFFFLTVLLGIILDVTMHQPLGLHILILGVSLSILQFLNLLLPAESGPSRYMSLFLVFFVYYLLNLFLLSFLQDGTLIKVTPRLLVKFLFNSLLSVGISVLIDRVFSSVRDSKNFDKIRLR